MDGERITLEVSARMPTIHGTFALHLFRGRSGVENLAATLGEVAGHERVLTRVHSECFTGDVLGSLRCDCGDQLQTSLEMIGRAGRGMLLYLRQEGRGIGLRDKLRAYNLQDEGLDTVDANLRLGHRADERNYADGAAMLRTLGPSSIVLLTNNPAKIEALRKLGVAVVGREAVEIQARPENAAYLRTKAERMEHLLRPVPRFEWLSNETNA